MVHAESSNFQAGVSKAEAYAQVLEQAVALFDDQRNWVCNTANTASLLWHALHALPSPSSHINWAGFYTLDPLKDEQLILGPFQGKVACQTIRFGRGVCGAAAANRRTQLVPDVHQFPGHIACDSGSQSEIVVPIVKENKVVAIIDIDCAVRNGFDDVDKANLEQLANILADACDCEAKFARDLVEDHNPRWIVNNRNCSVVPVVQGAADKWGLVPETPSNRTNLFLHDVGLLWFLGCGLYISQGTTVRLPECQNNNTLINENKAISQPQEYVKQLKGSADCSVRT